jgi:large subunit ribosomal protein L1
VEKGIKMGEQRAKKVSQEDMLSNSEKILNELEAKKAENIVKSGVKPKDVKKEKSKVSARKNVKKANPRSKKYQELVALVDKTKFYTLDNAIELVKKTAQTKFDSSIELHVRFLDKKGESLALRGLIVLKNKVGKEPKIGLLDEALIEKITKEKKTDFDILITTPQMMPKLARIAKILGPQGKMPNPKSGTITANPEKTIAELKAGKIEYKTDKQGILHQVVGKVSWENNKIKENVMVFFNSLPVKTAKSVFLCSTMGPSVKIAIEK